MLKNNECRSQRSHAKKWGAIKCLRFVCSARIRVGWPTSSLAMEPLNAARQIGLPPPFSSDRPFAFPLLSPPPSVRRCPDPSARWCITKDTCSVDVARQSDCVPARLCVRARTRARVFFGSGPETDSHRNCFKVNLSIFCLKLCNVGLFWFPTSAAGWNSVLLKVCSENTHFHRDTQYILYSSGLDR